MEEKMKTTEQKKDGYKAICINIHNATYGKD
jgi:hypothetical protein